MSVGVLVLVCWVCQLAAGNFTQLATTEVVDSGCFQSLESRPESSCRELLHSSIAHRFPKALPPVSQSTSSCTYLPGTATRAYHRCELPSGQLTNCSQQLSSCNVRRQRQFHHELLAACYCSMHTTVPVTGTVELHAIADQFEFDGTTYHYETSWTRADRFPPI